jgi:hypothetical protein
LGRRSDSYPRGNRMAANKTPIGTPFSMSVAAVRSPWRNLRR